ncbi:ion channel castor [Fagus crenata]
MAASVAILITVFSSLLHKNFSLQNQVNELQDQISKCSISIDATSSIEQEIDYLPSTNLKNLALILSHTLLSIPFLIFNCNSITYMSWGLALYGVTDGSLAECLWLSWTYIADSGNHAGSEGIGWKLVSVSISFGGMLIFAMMLGLVSDAIFENLDSLRKGRSEGSLLNQIAIANESLGGGIVVVMVERDKEEMDLDIAKMEFNFKGTSVICRSGSPLILADLKKVSVSKARAIIVLADDVNADQSDARALRTVLSLTGVKEGLRGHIVVELSDLDNEVLVKLVGGDLVETVVAHDVIGHLMIQCARQPGLAQIWEDILGFENCEFYIKRWPQLDGMQFEDVLISFPDAIPCGVKVASCGSKIILNPEDSYVLQEGDEVLVIAKDDDTYSPAALPRVVHNAVESQTMYAVIVYVRQNRTLMMVPIVITMVVWRGSLPKDFVVPKSTEKILYCGWRRDMEDMIMALSLAVVSSSSSCFDPCHDSQKLLPMLLSHPYSLGLLVQLINNVLEMILRFVHTFEYIYIYIYIFEYKLVSVFVFWVRLKKKKTILIGTCCIYLI